MSEYTGNKKLYIKNWYNAEPSQYADSCISFPDNETDGLGPDKLYGTIEEETESGYSNNYILNLQSDNIVDGSDYAQDPTTKIPYSSHDSTLNLYFSNQVVPIKNSVFSVRLSGLVTRIQAVELYAQDEEDAELSHTMRSSWEDDTYEVYYSFDETPTTLVSFPVPSTYTKENVPLYQIIWQYTTLERVTTNYYEHTVYSNQDKDFGVKLYSSGNWDDNTNPVEGLSFAHIIDLKHSGVSGFYFSVPDRTVISRIKKLYTQSGENFTYDVSNGLWQISNGSVNNEILIL